MQLEDTGAGHPDGGPFTADQIPESDVPLFDDVLFDRRMPARGTVEVKTPVEAMDDLQAERASPALP